MKKLFNKFTAGAITLALIATLALGVSIQKNANAESTLTLGKWSFAQGGQFNPDKEPWNTAYITGVTMQDTAEQLTGWNNSGGSSSVNQTKTATQDSKGFAISINGISQDRNWDTNPWRINPWAIKASVDTSIEPAHYYTLSFKAKASRKKYAYVAFSTEQGGEPPYGYNASLRDGSDNQLITIGTVEKTFSYTFDDFVEARQLNISLMMGFFGAGADGKYYDFDGNPIPTSIIDTDEPMEWAGTVTVSDVKIEDHGVNPDVPTDPTRPTTTAAPTTKAPGPGPVVTTKAPAPKVLGKVKGLKVKNNKKKKLKITWKKTAYAKNYEIKVGTKTYNSNKTSKTVKVKTKKGKKVTVKIRATAAGYTSGPWVTKKVKIKK